MRDGSSKMSTATSVQVDTSVLSSMEFEPVCECVKIDIRNKEILEVCDQPAEFVVIFHGILPSCCVASKLMCKRCVTSLKGRNCHECRAERFISEMPIKGKT